MNNTGASISLLRADSTDPRVLQLREDFHRIRYDCFVVELGWDPKCLSGLERDQLDAHSDFLVAAKGEKVVAGCRLLERSVLGKLPVENYLTETVEPGGVEISRMVAVDDGKIHMRMFYGVLLAELDRRATAIYMNIRESYLAKLRRHGFNCFQAPPGKRMEENGHQGKEYFSLIRLALGDIPRLLRLLNYIEKN